MPSFLLHEFPRFFSLYAVAHDVADGFAQATYAPDAEEAASHGRGDGFSLQGLVQFAGVL